jgi:hypothetical protein
LQPLDGSHKYIRHSNNYQRNDKDFYNIPHAVFL